MDDSLAVVKRSLRDQLRCQLQDIAPEEVRRHSRLAVDRLMSTEAFATAETLMLYMPIACEVDLTALMLRCFQESRTICVPRVDWDHHRMWPVQIHRFDDKSFQMDRYGLRMPDPSDPPAPPEAIDLAVIPGLGFDVRGYRLGRGGGYYDRFLSLPAFGGRKMGLCFDQQIIDRVPVAEHDVRMDLIVTDRRVITTAPCMKGGPPS